MSSLPRQSDDFRLTPEDRVGDRHSSSHSAARRPHRSAENSSAMNKVFVIFAVVLAAIISLGGWQFYQLNNELLHLQKQQDLTMGRVSQTGDDLTQSGVAVEENLKFLESEIRKLWDVSNKRNRSNIAENKSNITNHSKQIAQAKKSISALDVEFTEQTKILASVTTKQVELESNILKINNDMQRELMKLDEIIKNANTDSNTLKELAKTQHELSKKLASLQSQTLQKMMQLENAFREATTQKSDDLGIVNQ